jgi:hypothetical protein
MRFGLNKEQWDKLVENSDNISCIPATIGNFIIYFASKKELGVFNMAYDPKRDIFGVWFGDGFEKFEDNLLINAMFNLFCHLEGI